ncbi:MAG TPA: helix-turn-helix domain-containing protein [Fimbriimonadaceae bacterium]|nr:helix-turn-helix domain-containing protein [Fimbriimonadaceae bacterium]
MPADTSQILTPFGFTNLESEIYAFLLGESPATGYRVAQAIGKAAANTYKAIESLQQKGAVLVDEGSSRLCRAVPSDELLARLTRDFEWRRAEAELMLARLSSTGNDDRVYSLRSRAQVIERARHMIGGAESAVLMACTSHVAHHLRDNLGSAARRKIEVLVVCPDPVGIEGVQAVVSRSAKPLDEMRLVTDGAEMLYCLFAKGREEVSQAIWSKSPYLAISAHRGLAAELESYSLDPPFAESTPGYTTLVQNLTEV